MAWPCISRVCCLARFWNQLDKSDLAVPLTIHNYSDIEEAAEEGAEASGGIAQPPPSRIPTGGSTTSTSRPRAAQRAAAALAGSRSASARALRGRVAVAKRPSKRSRGCLRKEPFAAQTQYQQDFRAWPLQKRDALPWIGECRRAEPPRAPPAGLTSSSPVSSHVAGIPAGSPGSVMPPAAEPGRQVGSRDRGSTQVWASSSPPGATKSTSYRHEYRPWTAVKRSRPTKTTQRCLLPEDHFRQETSYKADFKIPNVPTKFSSNPSAVFQAPSHILSI